jgi:hypothetical protein
LRVFPPVVLAFLLLLVIQTELAASEVSSGESENADRKYMNLFEYRMCLGRDSN